MNYTFDDYSSAMKKLREELYNVRQDIAKEEFAYDSGKNDEDYLKKTREAYVNYKKSLNPYGTERENIHSSGLASSGKERVIYGNDFSEYQSYLARAHKEREDITTGLIKNLVSSQRKNDEEMLKYSMEEAKNRLENYWKEYSWAYKKERDELEDARYEKELKAKYGL